MVKNTDFNEEVTKHSVHTLVFRSLKRTHDMFVSDQGNLPDIDKEAEALLWKVKSKSVYGQVQQKVDQVRTHAKTKFCQLFYKITQKYRVIQVA